MLIRVLILFGLTQFSFDSILAQDYLLSKGKVGDVSIDMSPNEVYSLVGKENTKIVDLYLEAMYSPAIVLMNVEKEGALVFEIVCEKVWRINVYDPIYKTAKGIGVGSTMGELRKYYKVNSVDTGETGVYAYVEELEMSFCLDYGVTAPNNLLVDDVGSSTKIIKILIL